MLLSGHNLEPLTYHLYQTKVKLKPPNSALKIEQLSHIKKIATYFNWNLYFHKV